MKLPVKFATVQIQQELPDLARHPHVLVLGEQVHVPEAVDWLSEGGHPWIC